jgi:hypothetical protein
MKFITTIVFVLTSLTFSTVVLAEQPFHALYLDGEVVRTIVPPAAAPMTGKDNIYPVMGGVEDQLPVAAVGPGSEGYHGGKWAVHVVTWMAMVEPYLLTSEYEVKAAYYDGDITITRVIEADFKCPIQKQPQK